MRPIDADALVIDMVIEEAETPSMQWYPSHMPMRKTGGVSIEQINNSPTIDAVPVVRCKDCKRSDWYTGANGKHLFFCLEHGSSGHSGDDYCSYGEREEDE